VRERQIEAYQVLIVEEGVKCPADVERMTWPEMDDEEEMYC